MDAFVGRRTRRHGARPRRDEVLDRHDRGPPGRPPSDRPAGVGCGPDLLHRLEGAQHPHPRDGRQAGPQAERVRPVPGQEREAAGGARPSKTSTNVSACPTSNRRCVRIVARSRPRWRASFPRCSPCEQIRGDLHTHTDLTDGLAPLERMLEAAAAHRYAYYAVTDHAPNLYMQRMTDEKMLEQRRRLRSLARTGSARCACCTARSSTSTPTAAWTGTRSSSTVST